MTFALQPRDLGNLAVGVDLGQYALDPNLGRNALCCPACVAGALASGDEANALQKTEELLSAVQRFARTR